MKTTSDDKLGLRSKIIRMANSDTINKNKNIPETDVAIKQPHLVEQKSTINTNKVLKDNSFRDYSTKKYGKVKFFDSTKGFGYVRSIYDNKSYRFLIRFTFSQ